MNYRSSLPFLIITIRQKDIRPLTLKDKRHKTLFKILEINVLNI